MDYFNTLDYDDYWDCMYDHDIEKPMIAVNSKIDFGKYKGLSANDIVKTDPQYLLWVDV